MLKEIAVKTKVGVVLLRLLVSVPRLNPEQVKTGHTFLEAVDFMDDGTPIKLRVEITEEVCEGGGAGVEGRGCCREGRGCCREGRGWCREGRAVWKGRTTIWGSLLGSPGHTKMSAQPISCDHFASHDHLNTCSWSLCVM